MRFARLENFSKSVLLWNFAYITHYNIYIKICQQKVERLNIANLFENAINATAKLKGKGKNIDIQIKDNPERLLIKIDNPCRANLSFDETLYGIGIRSVITTTTKYEGMYDFTAEDGVFSAKIILNLR